MRLYKGSTVSELLVQVITRFPLPLLFVLVATYVGLNISNDKPELLYWRFLYAGITGFFASTALVFYHEARNTKLLYRLASSVLLAAFIIWYSYSTQNIYGHIFLLAASILSITFAPFIYSHNDKEQCNFTAELIATIRYVILSVVILFVGFSGIVLAIKYLFGVEISNDIFTYIWVLSAYLFAPIFFLSRLPNAFSSSPEIEYKPIFKFLLEYVIAPLIVVYLSLFYVYAVMIIIKGQLPNGVVGKLVSIFSFVGVFAFTMIQPIEYKLNKFASLVRNYFFHLLVLPLALFIVAVCIRITEFGITESRYILILIAAWLVICTFYFVILSGKSLKIINVCLFILLVVAAIGPLSAYNISISSQKTRLMDLLVKNNIFENGKIKQAERASDISKDYEDIKSIVEFFSAGERVKHIASWFPSEVTFDEKSAYSIYSPSRSSNITKMMSALVKAPYKYEKASGSIDYVRVDPADKIKLFSYEYDINENLVDTQGYKYTFNFSEPHFNNKTEKPLNLPAGKDGVKPRYILKMPYTGDSPMIYGVKNEATGEEVTFDIRNFTKDLKKILGSEVENRNVKVTSPELLSFEQKSGKLKAKMLIYKIEGQVGKNLRGDDFNWIHRLNFVLLLN